MSDQAFASQEVLDWISNVVHAAETNSNEPLFKLLRHPTNAERTPLQTVKIVNQCRYWIGRVFPWSPSTGENAKLATTALYLYYRTLFKLLTSYCEKSTRHRSQRAAKMFKESMITAILERDAGLINACIEVVGFCNLKQATAAQDAFPFLTKKMGRFRNGMELWRALEWMKEFHSQPSQDGVPPLPLEMHEYISMITSRLVEEIAWVQGSSIIKFCVAAGPVLAAKSSGEWTIPENPSTIDCKLLDAFLQAVGREAATRIGIICGSLVTVPALSSPSAVGTFSYRCCTVMTTLVANHLEVLFNQHLTAACICCIYYAARLHKIDGVGLKELQEIAMNEFAFHDESTFQQLDVTVAYGRANTSGVTYGDIRAYYDFVVMPCLTLYNAETYFGQGFSAQLGELPMADMQDQCTEPASPDEDQTYPNKFAKNRTAALLAAAAVAAHDDGEVTPEDSEHTLTISDDEAGDMYDDDEFSSRGLYEQQQHYQKHEKAVKKQKRVTFNLSAECGVYAGTPIPLKVMKPKEDDDGDGDGDGGFMLTKEATGGKIGKPPKPLLVDMRVGGGGGVSGAKMKTGQRKPLGTVSVNKAR